jgi:hypothetical protein
VTEAGQAIDLANILVSEEVRQIRRERWTGVLALAQGDVAKGLYFVDGEIVFAASTVEEDRLGANLYRIGRITEVQFRSAMNTAQHPGRRLGQALIESGVLTPAELAAAVVGQTERIVLSVLRWSSGRLQRRAMDRPLPADLILDLKTPRLLLLGARQFPNPGRFEPFLGEPGTRLRRVTPRPFSYDELPSSPPERAVLAACARETTLGDALRLPHPRSQMLRAVYGLVAGGMIETLEQITERAPAPVPVPPEPVRPTPTPPPAPVRPTPTPTPPSAPVRPTPTPPPVRPTVTPTPPPEPVRPTVTPTPPPEPVRPTVTPTPPPEPAYATATPTPTPTPMVEEADFEERERAPDSLSSPEVGEERVRSLLDKGQREAAVELLKKLVGKFPKAHRCRRQLAMILARSGSFDRDVERHFTLALEAQPGDVELRHSLASYYRRSGMGARAMLQLRRILSDDPGHAGAWRDLGELEAAEGRRGR